MSYFKQQLSPEELSKIESKCKTAKKNPNQELGSGIDLKDVKLDDSEPRTVFEYSKKLIPKHKKQLETKLKKITKQIDNFDKTLEKLKELKLSTEKELKVIENITFKN